VIPATAPVPGDDVQRFDSAALLDWTRAVMSRSGLAAADATLAADLIVETELRGVRTHGLIRLPTYVDKLASGEYNPTPQMRWSRRPGVIHLDADEAMGQIAAARAIDAACEMAAAQPSVLCFGTRLGHLGAVGGFALRAARRGFFAVVLQRTPPMMGLPGYRGPVIGNSPLAFASPVPGSAPIVFDMACSVAARGHVLMARQNGEPIPAGWALDRHGEPTIDADEAAGGMLLPMGGHKGLGLAMMVECLAGSLAAVAGRPVAPAPSTLGAGASGGQNAFFWVVNPALAGDADGFAASMLAWTTHVREAGGPAARLPGERAERQARDARAHGVAIRRDVVSALRALGERVGVGMPAARDRG